MALNQRILRIGAIVAVAGATGYVMQAQAPEALPLEQALPLTEAALSDAAPSTETADLPAELRSAALTEVTQTSSAPPADTPSADAAPASGPLTAQAPEAAAPSGAEALTQLAALAPETAPMTGPATGPTNLATPQASRDATPSCSADMALVVQPGAMLDLGLISPCRPHQRVVIRHAGLAVTTMTSAAGSLIASIPALQSPAEVSLSFLDGTTATETADVPDLARYDRFAIQWLDNDAFQLRAYPEGLTRGQTGVVAADSPGTVSAAGGYLLRLGDATAPQPLMAEVYTWPAGQRAGEGPVALEIEAAVSAETCAREILGETLQLREGALTLRDFSIEMPACSAVGEYVALPNPVTPEKLAAN